ncbi:MAG: TRAP transporter TatT component family protein [Pseudomonadota bacterium]
MLRSHNASPFKRRVLIATLAMTQLTALSGCGAIVSRATDRLASSLSSAVLNQDDPQTVADALPAYLVMLDALIENSPDNAGILGAAATLYAAYGATFVSDADRASRLTARARRYGQAGICAHNDAFCELSDKPFDEFDATLSQLTVEDVPAFYAYAVSWLAYMRAHASDFGVLADLPKVESVLVTLDAQDTTYEAGNIALYLGILNTLRPAALGGDPEAGRAFFEQAIELSDGRDLSAKVEFARGYARSLYERELHDRLLNDVIAADPVVDGLTLFNVMAQRQAHELLASADDYF